MPSGARSRSPAGRPASSDSDSTPLLSKNNHARGGATAASPSSSSSPPAAPGDDAPEVDHPRVGLFKDAPPAKLDQPLTATVAHSMPKGSWIRRMAMAALRADTRASTVLHRASLFPFDLLLVPFAMICGVYGMPFVIPLLGAFESPRLGATVLVSTLLTTLCTTVGKRRTKRLRPAPNSLARKFFDLRRLEHNFSFPSGDSAQGAVVGVNLYLYALAHIAATEAARQATGEHSAPMAAAVTLFSPLCFLALTPLVMTSRVYFGAHWWSDTFGGALIGAGCTLATWALLPGIFAGWGFGQAGGKWMDQPLMGGTPVMQMLGFRQAM